MDGVGAVGISLIGSSIFLICVDWVINRVEEQRKREAEIEMCIRDRYIRAGI